MRGRPEFYVRVMCPPYTAEDAEFLAERNKVLEEAVNRIAAENFELREDNRNLKESYRYLSTTRIEEKKGAKGAKRKVDSVQNDRWRYAMGGLLAERRCKGLRLVDR